MIRIDGLPLQAMLSLSMVVASGEAAGAALRRRCGLLRVLNSTAAGLLAMPIRRSRCDEARRLVAAGDALAVDEEPSAKATLWLVIAAVGGFVFTARRRRLLALPTRRILRAETRQLGAASRASRRR